MKVWKVLPALMTPKMKAPATKIRVFIVKVRMNARPVTFKSEFAMSVFQR